MNKSPVESLSLSIRLEREDSIPAFGGFMKCECQRPDHGYIVLMNVQAVMAPELQFEDGSPAPQTREERKRLIVTTLMHEFGHALESYFNLPVNEDALENACQDWELAYAKQNQTALQAPPEASR